MIIHLDIPDDLSVLPQPLDTLADVDAALADLQALRTRLRAVAYAPVQAAVQQQAYHEAVDGPDPAPGAPVTDWPTWRQPTGVHDAYPAGATRRHNNTLWHSDRAANVWEPGTPDSGWTALDSAPAPQPEPEAAPWVDGATYVIDQHVTHNGLTYRCIQAHTAWAGAGWTPDQSPSLWAVA